MVTEIIYSEKRRMTILNSKKNKLKENAIYQNIDVPGLFFKNNCNDRIGCGWRYHHWCVHYIGSPLSEFILHF